jgi:Fur family ferric uptake transcriptional regulator
MNANIIKVLENNNIKPTPMRMLVLEQLMLQQRNLSLSDMENLLYPSDRITIYRTLQTFIKHGLVHSIDTITNGSIYALCSEDCNSDLHIDHHPHFFCELCKQITCNNDLSYTIQSTTNSPQYKINKIEITIKGICPACNKA